MQSVMEGITELTDEIDSLHVSIAEQAMEYIHTEYVSLVRSLIALDIEALTLDLPLTFPSARSS